MTAPAGRWLSLAATIHKPGALRWEEEPIGFAAMVGRRYIGSVRCFGPHGWLATLHGWKWYSPASCGDHAKVFKTSREAIEAIDRAWAELEVNR